MPLPNLLRYIRGLIEESIKSSWGAANGLFGAVLAGAAMIWRGVLPIVSTDVTHSVSNWVLSFAIYAVGSWSVLFIGSMVFVAPYRLWYSEHAALAEKRIDIDKPAFQVISPAQDKLLSIIAKYQKHFAITKLIVGRNGGLHFDGDRSKGMGVDFVAELYGRNDAAAQANFISLMESMPVEYIRFFPEMRLDSPFVVSVTNRGMGYLKGVIK
jgi:hypothetical protein